MCHCTHCYLPKVQMKFFLSKVTAMVSSFPLIHLVLLPLSLALTFTARTTCVRLKCEIRRTSKQVGVERDITQRTILCLNVKLYIYNLYVKCNISPIQFGEMCAHSP
uniref:Uncharacterized protein n=1 Tax=Micrurus lemniscatus lemniscatus TaxID=129467 RepID=A0A2D4IMR7_MICLE